MSNPILANISKIEDSDGNGGEINRDKKGKSVKKKNREMAKSKNLIRLNCDFFSRSKNTKTSNGLDFLTIKARLAFTKFKQVFIKASILYQSDL